MICEKSRIFGRVLSFDYSHPFTINQDAFGRNSDTGAVTLKEAKYEAGYRQYL